MAIVQIKGSDQKVRFPNDMVEEQMLTALRNQFPRTINEKINDALSKPESTISNRDVSLAENTKQKIANFLYDNKIVSDRYGAQRIGDNLSSLLGVLPGIGDAQAGDEFGRAVAEGDGLGIGIGALSALPIVGDVAAKGARKVFHGSNKQIDEYMRGVNTKGRLGAGIYFGDEKKANVFAKMAKIKKQPSFLNQAEIVSDNPKQVTEDMLLLWPQGKFPAEVFEKEGYTGIQLINQNTGEIIEETVFDPKNIKSLNKPEAKPLGDAVKGVEEVTSKFNPKLINTKEGFQIKTDNGKLDGLSLGDDFMVKISKVEENSRGKGEGIELYLNAIEEARKKGFKRLVSDDETVDEPAIRIYEALERRGYKVDKHPDFKLVTNLKGSNFAYAGDNSAFSIDLSTIPTAKTMTASESLKSKYPDLSIGVRETDSNIILDKIIVPEKSKGTGTNFMNDLIVDADSKGKTIGLTPTADFGGSKARLTEFYKRFGFTENKGKNKDFTISESMIRKPEATK
jgi:predicted GNAT superfamily acetyltransferase